MSTAAPATAIRVNANHCIAYDRCGPSVSSGVGVATRPAGSAGVLWIMLM